jgi:hypothetical protein
VACPRYFKERDLEERGQAALPYLHHAEVSSSLKTLELGSADVRTVQISPPPTLGR